MRSKNAGKSRRMKKNGIRTLVRGSAGNVILLLMMLFSAVYAFGSDLDDRKAYNGHTYAVFDVNMNDEAAGGARDAEAFCESLGGHLVTISDRAESRFVQSLMKAKPCNYYWIGLFRQNGSWKWIDGTELSYTNWAKKEPSSGNYAYLCGKKHKKNNKTVVSKGRWGSVSSSDVLLQSMTFFRNEKGGLICEWDYLPSEVNRTRLTYSNTQLDIGREMDLSVLNNEGGMPSWKSSKPSVAKIVSDGWSATILGVKAGTAVITAKVGDNTYQCSVTVTESPKEALLRIGNKEYDTLKQALKKVKNGQTITLIRDLTVDRGETVKFSRAVSFTMDLNGHEVIGKGISANFYGGANGGANQSIFSLSKGTVVVKNGSLSNIRVEVEKNASLKMKKVYCSYIASSGKTVLADSVVGEESRVKRGNHAGFSAMSINGGSASFTDTDVYGLYVSAGRVTINRGYFSHSASNYTLSTGPDAVVTIKDGVFTDGGIYFIANAGKMSIKGGKFSGFGGIENSGSLTVAGGTLKGNQVRSMLTCKEGSSTLIKGGTISSGSSSTILIEEGVQSFRLSGGKVKNTSKTGIAAIYCPSGKAPEIVIDKSKISSKCGKVSYISQEEG